MKKRILSLLLTLLTLVMLVGIIPATTLTAFAANTDVPFTSDSKAAPGSSMTVDLDALAEQDEAFMEAYFNEDFTITWYLNGTKVTTNIGGSFGETINLTDADKGKSLYVTIEADGNTYTSKTFTVETPPDVYVGGVGMANGTYLANHATATRPDKPSVGYAYYKDGVLTLHNYSLSSSGGYMYDSAGSFALIYADKDLKIVLEGENTLKQNMPDNEGIYFRLNGEVSGDGTLAVSGYTYYGIAAEVGNLTVNAATVTVSGGKVALYSDQGNVIINGGYTDVSADQDAIYAKAGSVYITDGELTAKSATDLDGYLGSGRNYCAIKGAGGVSYANHLIVKAALKDDGQLGAYSQNLQNSYDLIVVKNYPILLGVKTTGGMVDESGEGGIVFFDSCESVFSRECNEETTWTVSELRTESGELNTQPVVGETYYFDITVNGENINFSGVSATNCDVKLDFYDVAFVKATKGAVHATITFSATRKLTHDVVFYSGETPISGRTIEDGHLVTKPEDPVREGVHFFGWYTEDGELYDFDAPVTENINLYAVFGHYVSFHVGETTSTQFVVDGKTMTEPIPSKEGYAFKGWYTADNKYYDFTTPVTGDLELYAKLVKLHTVTITVRESTSTQIVEDGKTAIKPGISGNEFIGWYTADDQPYDFSTPVTGDLEIYAKFAEIYTVTYYAGTIVVSSRTVVEGNTAEKIAAPVLDGIFMGWYTEVGEPYDFTTPVTQDLNLYATYAEVALDGVLLLDGYYLPRKSTTPTKTKPSGGYAYYKDGTLTLNNYTNTGAGYSYKLDSSGNTWCSAIYCPGDLNIVLAEGTSNTIINNMPVYGVEQWCNAICVVGDLTITGNGSLTAACADYAIRAGSLTADIASFRASGCMYITDNGALSMELSGSFLSDRYIQAGTINIKAKGDITISSAENTTYVQNYAETGSSSLISETGKVKIVSFASWALNIAHDLTVSAADTIYLESIGSNALGGSEGNLTLTAPNGITINSPSYTSYVLDKFTATATNGAITVYGSLYTGEFDIRAKDDVTVNGGYIECSNSDGEGSIVSESGNVSISSSDRSVYLYGNVTINAAKNISITADVPLDSTTYTLYGEGNLNLTAGENIELLTNSGYLGDFGGLNATATNGNFVAKGELYIDTINIKANGDVTVTDSHMSIYTDKAHSIVSEAGNVTLAFTGYNSLSFYGNMTVSAAKKLTITSPDYYAIYACGNVTLTAGEGMEINSYPGYYIYCSGQQFIANVTGGDFVANSTFRVDNMTVTAAGDVTIHGQLESDGLAKISSLNGDILISAPTGKEALYYGDYYFKVPNGTTTITSDVNNSRYGLINHVDTITAEGPLKIVNPGGYALMDELKITGDEVTIIGDPTGTSDDPLTYENRNGKAYAIYEGTSEAALTVADHEAAGEVYVGYLDTGVVKFVEEDYVSTQPVKKLELELEGFDTDSELLILKGKVTSTGATIRPGGYTRGMDVLEDSDGSPGYSTTKTRLNADTDYWVKFMVRATDGYSLADITAADVTLKGYEDITPILSYDEDSEILTLFFPMAQLKPVVRVGGVKLHSGEYLDESGKIHTTALTDNYAYFKDGVLTLHNYDYTGAGYKFYEEYYEGTYYCSEAAIHSRYDLEIVLDAGTVNTLNAEDLGITLYNYDGSFINAALTISGTGKLVVNSGDEGIYVPEGNLAVNDADLEITSASHAIRVYGDVTVTDASLDLDNATVEDQTIYIRSDLTATGSDLVINSGDYGIYVLNNVVLKDCSLELQTVKASICADGRISMDGCTATVNSGDAVGIVGYDIEIKNTDLTIDDCGIGIRANHYSYGGYKGSILIQDSFVEITADHDGIRAEYDVTVGNSNVIVKTTDTGSDLNYFAIRIYSPGKLVLGENLVIQGSTDPDGTLGECDLTTLYNYDYISITPACIHKWDSGVITTEPSCDTEGVKTYTCENGCGITKTEAIEALGHTWDEGEIVHPATVDKEGEKRYTCLVCGDTKTETIPKLVLLSKAISYDGNGALSGEHETEYILETYTYTLPECNFTPQPGQLFRCWRVKGVDMQPGESFVVETDTVITAIWRDMTVFVGGVEMDDGYYLATGSSTPTTTKPSGGYAFYDDGKLVLNNYSYTGFGVQFSGIHHAAIFSAKTLNIELIGTNTLTLKQDDDHLPIGIVLRDDNSSLEIRGEGSLSITGGGTAIEARKGGIITVHSGTITTDCDGTGIKSDLTDFVMNGGNVTLVSKQATGMMAGSITVNGGTLDVTGAPYGQGIASQNGDIIINGGKVIVRCNDGDGNDDENYALRVASAGKLVIADKMNVQASTQYDGTLGDFVEADYKTYDRVVIEEAIIRTVTFIVDSTVYKTEKVKDKTLVAQPADPELDGWKFLGWYNGDTKFDFTTPITGDITLTAKFEKVASNVLKGDVDLDGDVDMDDVVALMSHVLMDVIITDPTSLSNGEVTNDTTLNMDDVVKLMRYVLSDISTLD